MKLLESPSFSPAAWAGIDVPSIAECETERDIKRVKEIVSCIRTIKEMVFTAHACEGKAMVYEAEATRLEARLANERFDPNTTKKIRGQANEQRALAGWNWEKIRQYAIEIEMLRLIATHDVIYEGID